MACLITDKEKINQEHNNKNVIDDTSFSYQLHFHSTATFMNMAWCGGIAKNYIHEHERSQISQCST